MTVEQLINSWKHERELSECVCSCFVDQVELSLVNETIDLITRQQAEIERLEKESNDKERVYTDEYCLRKEWQRRCRELLEEKQNAKSEAVREFAKRLQTEIEQAVANNCNTIEEREKRRLNRYKDVVCLKCDGKIDALRDIDRFIFNLVKEMVGE